MHLLNSLQTPFAPLRWCYHGWMARSYRTFNQNLSYQILQICTLRIFKYLELTNNPLNIKSCWWLTHPFEKYVRQIRASPQVGAKIKSIWNHHMFNFGIFVFAVNFSDARSSGTKSHPSQGSWEHCFCLMFPSLLCQFPGIYPRKVTWQ